MPAQIVRVVPADYGWTLGLEGPDRSLHHFSSLEAAIEAGWACAMRENADLHLLRHDGSVRFCSPFSGHEVEGTEAQRNGSEMLEEFDETERAIARARERIDAQEQRIEQLQESGIDSQTSEMILACMRESLEKLHMLRVVVMHAIAYRKASEDARKQEQYRKDHPNMGIKGQ